MRVGKTAWMALAITLCGVVSANASQQAGKVKYVASRASDGLTLIELDGDRTAMPACAKYAYWMVKAEASGTGKQHYAALLGAKLAGKTVRVVGERRLYALA